MKRFLKKVTILVVLFVLMWAVIVGVDFLIVGNQYLNNYQASILDKIKRASEIQGPKVLLVGNSNVSFGFDSGLLEEQLGLPVVNMGIHSGLSNAFQEDMAKPYISEGDIVLLCHNSYSDGYGISDVFCKPFLHKGGCGHKVGPDIEKYQEVYDVLIRTTKESRGIIFPV